MRRLILAGLLLVPSFAFAGEADVTAVTHKKASNGTYYFSVTVKHADTGWDHFANRWEVVDADGNVIATRVLAHPHVDEQPFTRSKSGIKIPEGTKSVIVRANDSVHGLGGAEITVQLD